jgi:hypothetical protein
VPSSIVSQLYGKYNVAGVISIPGATADTVRLYIPAELEEYWYNNYLKAIAENTDPSTETTEPSMRELLYFGIMVAISTVLDAGVQVLSPAAARIGFLSLNFDDYETGDPGERIYVHLQCVNSDPAQTQHVGFNLHMFHSIDR